MKYIISESRLKKIYKDIINKAGVEVAMKYVGGPNQFFDAVGDDLSFEDKLDAIDYVVKSFGGSIYLRTYGDEIFHKENELEYEEIYQLFPSLVDIEVWDKDSEKIEDKYSELYINLNKEVINRIYYKVVDLSKKHLTD